MVLSQKILEVSSLLSCNCLLSGCVTSEGTKLDVLVGCYDLSGFLSEPTNANYTGSVTGYSCELGEDNIPLLRATISTQRTVASSTKFPGIFDLTAFDNGRYFMASCTDGAVRLLKPFGELFEEVVFSLHNTMLTSCSVFCFLAGDAADHAKWLCTAHEGDVIVYDPIRKTNVVCLEKHDYDAWCSATIGSEVALSGGDDGFLKWHDVRCGKSATGRMRFNAGVVSIAPVAEGDIPTTYSLVGSYDENLYLVDSRLQKRPLASIGLGGGVWRCSRQLFLEKMTVEAEAAMNYQHWVQPHNALVVPVMQRGVALVRYGVNTSQEKSFSCLSYLHGETGSNDMFLPPDALFYDCAVIRQPRLSDSCELSDTAVVATCDFYNKRVALWDVSGI